VVQGVLQLVLQTPVPTHVWPQSSYWGLLVYGLCVMALEFAPLGGVNPKEVAEYLSASNVGIRGVIQYLAVVIPRLHGFLPYFTLSLDFLNPLHFWPLPHLRRALASASTG
jgi:hypothetical protein